MNFIVDAQLPRDLCSVLAEAGYDAIHTSELPEQNRTPDRTINALSFAEQRVVITRTPISTTRTSCTADRTSYS